MPKTKSGTLGSGAAEKARQDIKDRKSRQQKRLDEIMGDKDKDKDKDKVEVQNQPLKEALMESQQNPSAKQTIEAVQRQLQEAAAEAFDLNERLVEMKERIKAYRTALNGVQLGAQQATEAAVDPETAE